MQRAQAGDFGAFSELARPYRPGALRVATVVLGTAEGADDIVQDSTIRCWQSIDHFERGRPFRPWLLRIVANRARNERRAKGRRAHLAVRASRADVAATGASPEDLMVTDLERRQVVDALNRLVPHDRLVLALRFFEHLSEREMAEVLECAEGTVKSRLSRAKARLRIELERSEPEREEVSRRD